MMIDPVTLATTRMSSTPASSPNISSRNVGGDGASFSSVFRGVVQESTRLDDESSSKVIGLLRGDGTDVHQAMIATQKAEIAFELAMQVRNRAVGAYQQLMQMQF